MSWPLNLPIAPDFSTSTDATRVQESFGRIASTGQISSFSDLVSNPNSTFNSQFNQIQNSANGAFVGGMSGLPPGFQITGGNAMSAPSQNEGLTNKIKVRLVPVNKTTNAGSTDTDGIVIEVSPVINEQRQATWDGIQVTHHPGEILAYKTTTSRTWDMSGIKLVSRTPDEAKKNLILLNKIRSWVMPYYGYGTEKSQKNKLGAPPTILTFSAYGSPNIGPVPVVLLSYTFTYPNDVDYIYCSEEPGNGESPIVKQGTPFPIIADLGLNLKEIYSPREFSAFDISSYKNGDMENAYNVYVNGPSGESPKTTTAGAQVDRSEPSSSTPAESAAAQPVEISNTNGLTLETSTPVENNINGFY